MVGGPSSLYVVGFGLASISAIVFLDYSRMSRFWNGRPLFA